HVFPSNGGCDPLEESAETVASILGGDNSRFYWEIEQKGIAPSVSVWRIDYEDCGVMVLAGECDPEKCEELFDAMQAEAVKLTRDGPRPEEVQRVKNRRRTSLAIESESPYYRLGQLLDDVDYRGGPRTVEQRLAEVDAVSRKSIGEYLEEYPITEGGHVISVGPRDWIPSN
ncbi:MAG: insulinase family protein, partial [Planctomycetes bacterium]|nr:insulinase family protein [Planctomycetota bacterium]